MCFAQRNIQCNKERGYPFSLLLLSVFYLGFLVWGGGGGGGEAVRYAISEQSRGVRGHPPPEKFTLPEMQSSAFI